MNKLLILGRGLVYTTTTFFVLVSGCILANEYSSNLLLIAVIPCFAFAFFVTYAICFNFDNLSINNTSISSEILYEQDRIIQIAFLVSLLATTILLLIYNKVIGKIPNHIIILLSCYALIYIAYGSYLYNLYRKDQKLLTVRHRISWPIILTIAFSLYLALFFKNLTNEFYYLFPLIAMLIFFLLIELTTKSSWKRFVMSVLFFSSTILLLVIFTIRSSVDENNLKTMIGGILLCIIVSIYLGVFEAWKLTAYIKKLNLNKYRCSYETKELLIMPKWLRFYFSTLWILMLSIFLFPFIYLFTIYGAGLFWGFAVHSLIAFTIWSVLGYRSQVIVRSKKILLYNYWGFIKITMGFIFLFILINNSAPNIIPDISILPSNVGFIILTLLSFFTIYFFVVLRKECGENYRNCFLDKIWIFKFFTKPVNFFRVGWLLAYILWVTVFIIKESEPKISLIQYKSDVVYIFYLIILVICLYAEGYYGIKNFKKNMKLKGFLQTSRIFTSIIISLIVFLPAFKNHMLDLNNFLLAFNLFLTSLGGFALNDYYDFKKDSINKPHRAIPSGKLTSHEVYYIAIITLSLSFILAIYNSIVNDFGYVQFLFLISMIFYNYLVKEYAIIKTVYTALISSMIVSYPIIIYNLESKYFFLSAATFFFILGREIFMDILDLKGDIKAQIKTLPMNLGFKPSSFIAFTCILMGTILVIPLFISSVTLLNSISLIIIILSIIFFFLIWFSESTKYKKSSIIYLWIPMLTGLSILFI